MNKRKNNQKPGANIVRISRLESIKPINISTGNFDFKKQFYNPSLTLFLLYVSIIIIETFLLLLPQSTVNPEENSFIKSLFTATSSFTLTGLIVENTNEFWTPIGKTIIVFFIFIGGIGFMTSSSFILKLFGQKISLTQQILLRESIADSRSLGNLQIGNIISTLGLIVSYSVFVQVIIAVLLTFIFIPDMNLSNAILQGIAHSISSFNGAGFIFFNNEGLLGGYENNSKILITIGAGLFLGSIGYLVFLDLIKNLKWQKFSLNSKIVISSTIFLNVIGTIVFFILESSSNTGVLDNLSTQDSIKHSIFNTISGRTAGFSSLPFNLINSSTLIWCSTLMFIGGASASTAGGIKVNTFMVIFAFIKSTITGSSNTSIFGRKIPDEQVKRCITIATLGIFTIILSLILISSLEKNIDTNSILFEICSAFGTVGLSSGFIAVASNTSKIILTLLMILGRIGPISMILALGNINNPKLFKYAEERVTIG
ncbi:MAG: hypothetical protein CL730_02560 [Chloroflexi bacterium]|nr:hypothetical protein [Chloroflexota bacterium]